MHKQGDTVGKVLATIFFSAIVLCLVAIAIALTVKAIEALV